MASSLRSRVVFGVMAAIISFGNRASFADPNITDIEKAVIKARTDIQSAYVEVESLTETNMGRRQSTYKMWLSGKRFRTDQSTGSLDANGKVSVYTARQAILTPEEGFERILDSDPITQSRIAIRRLSPTEPTSWNSFSQTIFDPRLLGLGAIDFVLLPHAGFHAFVACEGLGARKVETVAEADGGGFNIEVPAKTGLIKLRVASDGVSIKHLELQHVNGVNAIECELTQYNDGIVYPRLVTFQSVKSGKVERKNVVTVKEANFNIKIPDETFTLAGLGVEAGTLVLEPPSPY